MERANDSREDLTKISCMEAVFQELIRANSNSVLRDAVLIADLTGALLRNLISHAKITKHLITLYSGNLDVLGCVLENSKETNIIENVVGILYHMLCVQPKIGGAASKASLRGLTTVLMTTLVFLVHDVHSNDQKLISSIYLLLIKIGIVDKKMGVKARLHGVLPVTMSLLQIHMKNHKFLLPLLKALKLFCSSNVNVISLGKQGAINILFTMLQHTHKKHTGLNQATLDVLVILLKSKKNLSQAIQEDCARKMLSMFLDWHKHVGGKRRHIKEQKTLLTIIKNFAMTKAGKQALTEAGAVQLLYKCCVEEMQAEAGELAALTSIVLKKCFPSEPLPHLTTGNVYDIALPQIEHDSCCSYYKETASFVSEVSEVSTNNAPFKQLGTNSIVDSDRCEVTFGHLNVSCCAGLYSLDVSRVEEFFPELYAAQLTDSRLSRVHYAFTDSLFAQDWSFDTFVPTSKLKELEISAVDTEQRDKNECDCKNGTGITSAPENMVNSIIVNGMNLPFDVDDCTSCGSGSDSDSTFHSTQSKLASSSDSVHSVTRKNCLKSNVRDEIASSSQISSVSKVADDRLKDYGGPKAINPHYCDNSRTMTSNKFRSVYMEAAKKTISMIHRRKVPFADLCPWADQESIREPLQPTNDEVKRNAVMEDIKRTVQPTLVINRIVYNLDEIVEKQKAEQFQSPQFCQDDTRSKTKDGFDTAYSCLQFDSQFESGNLRLAMQVRDNEYDLILSSDINSQRHFQWFYFSVSNMVADVLYRFNIINCEKGGSQFSSGMQPVMFSVTEALEGRAKWTRVGSNICYYKNHYKQKKKKKNITATEELMKNNSLHYTASFSVGFPHTGDTCYLAYHYPYTYSLLQVHLVKWNKMARLSDAFYRSQVLCQTLAGNDVHVLTITGNMQLQTTVKKKRYILLSARVHPGESNASWMMKGTIEFLLSTDPIATELRAMYVFKIIPMLNPDGVINGSHRCSLIGEDLNRKWNNPCPVFHPTIYHTKWLASFLVSSGTSPFVFCDYHGHSCKKNIFLYGCSAKNSWREDDVISATDDKTFLTLPVLLQQKAPSFNLSQCAFHIDEVKENTARVVMWREMGISRSYTMESTYCGCDQGEYQGYQLGIVELEEMGRKFCEALVDLPSTGYLDSGTLYKAMDLLVPDGNLSDSESVEEMMQSEHQSDTELDNEVMPSTSAAA